MIARFTLVKCGKIDNDLGWDSYLVLGLNWTMNIKLNFVVILECVQFWSLLKSGLKNLDKFSDLKDLKKNLNK